MITEEDFSMDELVKKLKKPEMGAIVTFLGVVRDEGIRGMEVDVYDEMADEELAKLERDALEKFEVEAVEIVHRKGSLKVGENIVVILVGAKHRKDAFMACEYLIDELKERVPIWKKELEEKSAQN
ncbi:Molybdopterin synthase catalytic subunit [subsurface metagenome]|nr:molybdenum cofactor biosynthesis protein MoaE [Methanosarcinales archaeon]